MYIHKVISFNNSWKSFITDNSSELDDMILSLDTYGELGKESSIRERRESWESCLDTKNWEIIEKRYYTEGGRGLYFGTMGPTKNGVSAQIPFGNPDYLSRWLFQQSPLAIRHNLIRLPILLTPMEPSEIHARSFSFRAFEKYKDQLQLMSPLHHKYPFLILGFSKEMLAKEDIEVIEIESEDTINEDNVINKCIEFPAEYHQAGLGILNYFGTYLREKYPDEDAKVKIEQDGLKVRLTIESKDGSSEIIEKALHEYELIVTNQVEPEKFTSNTKLLLELKQEIMIKEMRIENQNNIIGMQNDRIGMQNDRIDKLFNVIHNGLSTQQPIAIDFKPIISLSNNVEVNQDISSAISNTNELLELLPQSSDEFAILKDLTTSLEKIENVKDPEFVKKSPVMNKFKRILDKFKTADEGLGHIINTTESGIEVFQDLSKKYNKIADWCGLPQVPSALL